MITVLGIDPGLAATGIGVVSGRGMQIETFAYGFVSTSKDQLIIQRLNHIYTNIQEVLEKNRPTLMVVEDVFSLDKYPKSGITLGKVSGVILLAGYRFKIPVMEIPVRLAKQILTGNGNSSKEQLEAAVRHRLNAPSPIRPFHASDALGLAMIGLFRYAEKQALSQFR
jgi:crossover junction endodeoxyribonuclease RuvC